LNHEIRTTPVNKVFVYNVKTQSETLLAVQRKSILNSTASI